MIYAVDSAYYNSFLTTGRHKPTNEEVVEALEDIKKKVESGHLSAVDRMERRMANSLANAKKNGIASSRTVAGMAAYSKSSFIGDFDSVYHQPNVVQQSFWLKVLGPYISE